MFLNIVLILKDDLLFYCLMVNLGLGILMPTFLEPKVGVLTKLKAILWSLLDSMLHNFFLYIIYVNIAMLSMQSCGVPLIPCCTTSSFTSNI